MPIPKEKRKFALWLRPETLAKIEKLYRDDDCRSRSEFIEKAVLFYAGYLTADDGQEYFQTSLSLPSKAAWTVWKTGWQACCLKWRWSCP